MLTRNAAAPARWCALHLHQRCAAFASLSEAPKSDLADASSLPGSEDSRKFFKSVGLGAAAVGATFVAYTFSSSNDSEKSLPARLWRRACDQECGFMKNSSPFLSKAAALCKGISSDAVNGDTIPVSENPDVRKRPFRKWEETAVFAGSSGELLAQQICSHLGVKLGRVDVTRFADGEVGLRFGESIRGKDVYIVQPTSPPVNENLVELLLMISTLKRSSAKKITAVIPYYGYARQDRKMNSRVPISAADVALMIETMGADRVISVDLHSGQIQGFFRPAVPVDNLEAGIVGLKYFLDKKLEHPVIVSPDAGGVYRARKFQEGMSSGGYKDVGIAMLIKQRLKANEIDRMDLVGVVKDCDVVIVDDMIDTAGTLCEAAFNLKRAGARRVYAFATHGLFSGKALERIENSVLEEVVVTDSIQLTPQAAKCSRIKQLSIATMLADVIRRIHHKESLEPIFHAQHLREDKTTTV